MAITAPDFGKMRRRSGRRFIRLMANHHRNFFPDARSYDAHSKVVPMTRWPFISLSVKWQLPPRADMLAISMTRPHADRTSLISPLMLSAGQQYIAGS